MIGGVVRAGLKGLGVGGRGINSLLVGAGRSGMLTSAAKSAAYMGSASFLEKYAEGNFENESTKTLAGIAAFGLRVKGYQFGLQSASRGLGAASSFTGRNLGDFQHRTVTSIQRHRGVKIFGKRVNVATATKERTIGPRRENFLEKAGAHLSKGGKVDKFLGMGIKDAFKGRNGKGFRSSLAYKAASSPFKFAEATLKGTGEYASLIGGTFKSGGKNYMQGWTKLGTGLADMKHPFAPMITGGLLFGGVNAYQRRYTPFNEQGFQPNPANWQYTDHQSPDVYRGTAEQGATHIEAFGGGIQFGRPSAIKSQAVRNGQQAVTGSMLRNRRI